MDEKRTELLSRPLRELHIDVRLRRSLLKLGFRTLGDVLRAGPNALENELDSGCFSALVDLLHSLDSDFENLYRRLAVVPLKKESLGSRCGTAAAKQREIRTSRIADQPEYFHQHCESIRLPRESFTDGLSEIESDAERAIASLENHAENAIVAECFPKLALQLVPLRNDVLALFNYFQNKDMAVEAMYQHYPNSFLVFVANYASEDFDGDVLWNKLFDFLAVDRQSVQNRFKKAFYQGLVDRRLPVFSEDESGMYLRSTAILHGGLSKSVWAPLWKNLLLPYARKHRGFLPHVASRQVVASLKSEGAAQLRRTYAVDVIKKAPYATLEPLIESALCVADDVVKRSGADVNRFQMLDAHGLPDAAMLALRETLESGHSKRRRYVYLPSAELMLDLGTGEVHLHWDAQVFPDYFAGRTITYRVNGAVMHTEAFTRSVGKSVLQAVDISVGPDTRFEIELRLSDAEGQSIASMQQSFKRSKPGIFEFISSPNGFKLRKPGWVVKRKTTVAYLIRADYRIEPGVNMTPLENYEAGRGWIGASIQLFEIGPGSSGFIRNEMTGVVVAAWQEGYRTELNRSGSIGKAESGRDLYGYAYDETDGENTALPEIYIDVPSADESKMRDEIIINCTCDGNQLYVHQTFECDKDGFDFCDSGRFVLSFARTNGVRPVARECHIWVEHVKSRAVILDYQFAVVPISNFGIEELFIKDGSVMATYGFTAQRAMTVPDEFGDYEMMPHDRYQFDVALSDGRKQLDLEFESGQRMAISLFLAALNISTTNVFVEVASKRPLYIFDGETVDGRVSISSTEHRRSRGCFVRVGSTPVLYRKEMLGLEEHSFDIFGHPEYFRFNGTEETKSVRITICFGVGRGLESSDAVADIDIAELATGLGLGEVKACVSRGTYGLRFDNPAPCDLRIELTDGLGARLGDISVTQGDCFVPLPQEAQYAIDTKRSVVARIARMNLFGDADKNATIQVQL